MRWITILIFGGLILVSTSAMPVHAEETPKPEYFTRSLHVGMHGADVLFLQSFLKEAEFFSYPSLTGTFGAYTQSAVIAFQKTHGIDPVGIVGPLTRAQILMLVLASLQQSENTVVSTSTPHAITHGGNVAADTQAPTVTLAALRSSYATTTVTLSATGEDNRKIAGVQFAIDGSTVGNEIAFTPYTYTWDSTPTSDGSHTITATARDAAGNVATSTAVLVTVDHTAPSATITAPGISVLYDSGVPITLSATASDANTITKVEFIVKNSMAPYTVLSDTTDTSSPYAASWIVPAPGTYILTVIATDGAGNTREINQTFNASISLSEA